MIQSLNAGELEDFTLDMLNRSGDGLRNGFARFAEKHDVRIDLFRAH
jgi:hypothetical protein